MNISLKYSAVRSYFKALIEPNTIVQSDFNFDQILKLRSFIFKLCACTSYGYFFSSLTFACMSFVLSPFLFFAPTCMHTHRIRKSTNNLCIFILCCFVLWAMKKFARKENMNIQNQSSFQKWGRPCDPPKLRPVVHQPDRLQIIHNNSLIRLQVFLSCFSYVHPYAGRNPSDGSSSAVSPN